jgi:spore maturation protein CgeB
MSRRFHIAYVAHSVRSDWNNGNAHFLRGLIRALGSIGHDVTVWESETAWSVENLRTEDAGARSLENFACVYNDLNVRTYIDDEVGEVMRAAWAKRLLGVNIVILHEWNPPALAQCLLALRETMGFKLVFHDTHHRASSSPEQLHSFGLNRFDCVLAFGEALRTIYRERFGIEQVRVLHEAADVTVFTPMPNIEKTIDAVWIGNWGEGERSQEIRSYYLDPAKALSSEARFEQFGVRYPEDGLDALRAAGIVYRGYLPNLDAPRVYASTRLTVHIPRQQYSAAMKGIPTIRVFEALACGIPLISAPWEDCEKLFSPCDYTKVENTYEMVDAMRQILRDPARAEEQAYQGRETVLARHTCDHRANELTAICEEILL